MQGEMRAWPKNLEAERSVLGGILIENETIDDALPLITPQSFHDPANGLIFGRMIAMRDRKIPIELVTLKEHLEREDELEKAHGPAYIGSLVDGVPRSTNVAYYADIVRQKATLRALIRAAHQIANDALDASDDADDILNRAEAAVMSVAKAAIRGDFVHVSELVQRSAKRFIEAHENPRIVTGLSTGIADLDKMLRGLQPADVIYLGAGSSRGKSALMMQMAHAIAVQDVAGIVSLEMSADALIDRSVAQVAGVDAFRMKTGHLTPYEQRKCGQAFEILTNSSLYIDDVVGLTATQMRAKVRRFASRKKLKALFIDYAQLMTDGGKFSTRNEEIAAISRGWKLLAIELNIPIVILSQLSREGTKQDDERPPTLSHLRDCLPGSALVTMDDGSRTTIASLAAGDVKDRQVVALDDVWRLQPKGVYEVWPVGPRQMVVITTATGRRLRCSTEHKLFTEHGWQPAHQIAVGTLAGVPRVVPQFRKAVPAMTTDQALLLGWITGDGNLQGSPQLTVVDSAEADFAVALGKKCFRVEPRIKNEHERTTAKRVTFTTGRLSGAGKNPMTLWFRHLGVWNVTGSRKHVPEIMFSQPNDVIAAYLRGLFHADGSLSVSKAKNRPTLKLTTISEDLARGVQDLLTRLGIVACVKSHRNDASGFRTKHGIGWTVGIYNNVEIERFIGDVGFLLTKHERAKARFRKTKASGSSHIDRLPKVVNERVTALRLANKWSHTDLGWRVQGKAMSRHQCALLALKLNDPILSRWAHSDLLWDRVVSIEAAPDEECYDITVNGLHNFIADGFITHNSGALEQDADVVLLIWRHTENGEKVVDLIVAKQRNGPTGLIRLHWFAEQMRFASEKEDSQGEEQQAEMAL